MLSPSNARYDRAIKQPFYARTGVAWLWLVDSREQTIQVSELVEHHWVIRAVSSDEAAVRLPPFEQIELPLRIFGCRPALEGARRPIASASLPSHAKI